MSISFFLTLSMINSTYARAARVVLALYALNLQAQPVTVGLLAATFSIFPMLLSVPAGRLADRFGARWMLIISGIGGALGLLLPFAFPGLPAIFVAAAVIGMAFGVHDVLIQNVVGLLSTPQNRQRNFSNLSLVWSAGNFIAPLFAGFSIDYSGHAVACLYVAVLTLAPVVMLAFARGDFRGSAPAARSRGGGVRAMLSEPGVRKSLVTTSLQTTGQDLYQFYMPIYMYAIGLSASTIGIVLAVNSVAMFVMRLALPQLVARFKEEKVLAYAFYVAAASFILTPFSEDTVMLALISFLFGLGMGCQGPIITNLMFGNAPQGRSGEALGLRMTAGHLTKMVSPVMFGAIGSAFGLFPVFWISALMMGAGGYISEPKRGD